MDDKRVVTRLERQKKNTDRINVYLNDEFAFGLNIMDAMSLKKGQVLSEKEIADLAHRDDIAKATDKAINFLAVRPRSMQEVRISLTRKGFSETVIDISMERLLERGYVDDLAFTRFWVDNRTQFKPRGSRALRFELRQKGVASSVIDQVLADLPDPVELAYKAAQPRVGRYRGKTQAEFQQKMSAFLARRGFGYDAVRDALRKLVVEIKEENPTYFAQMEEDTLTDR